MMLRGESTRKAELADLCGVLFPDESSECLGLVLRTNAGKTIPLAMGGNLRMQHYHVALRYRDPVLCPVGAVAHWLVLRREIYGETRKLSLARKEISDDTQRNWIVPALEAIAVVARGKAFEAVTGAQTATELKQNRPLRAWKVVYCN